MAGTLTSAMIHDTLQWACEQVLQHGPNSAWEKADQALRRSPSIEAAAGTLIRRHSARAAMARMYASSASVPAHLPRELACQLFVQLRLIAGLAFIGGHEPMEARIKARMFACLMGEGATVLLKPLHMAFAVDAYQSVSSDTLLQVGEEVSAALLAQAQGRSPWLGGLFEATLQGIATYTVGCVAREVFVLDPVLGGVARGV